MSDQLEKETIDMILAELPHPDYQSNLEWDILLTISIRGGFYAYASHSHNTDREHLTEIIGDMNERIFNACAPAEKSLK